MSETINWLLLTDLHLGLDDQSWLWPKVKYDFFEDLKKMANKVDGKIDLVFFTGDLVQKGSHDEFDKLSNELEDFWKKLINLGSNPKLCPVPGNHDLTRPQKESAALRSIKNFWNDEGLRKTFWSNPSCEERNIVNECFCEYTEWLSRVQVPIIERHPGTLPGDFSAIYEKNNVALGIIGLNSAFLQLADGNFNQKLAVHVSQLNAVCDNNPSTWLKTNTANLLLSHQPPSWLNPEALTHYRQEIYSPGRFYSHLCGHLHDPEMYEVREAGSCARRYRHGTSLFGLENLCEATQTKRKHGYMIGQFVFDETNSIEKIWPRCTMPTRSGSMNFCPDCTFEIDEDNCVVSPLEIKNDDARGNSDRIKPQLESSVEIEQIQTVPDSDFNLLDNTPDEATSQTRLVSCPRLSLTSAPHHRAIRLEEQSLFEHEMRKSRAVWLSADWGTGKEGFLAAVFDRFRNSNNKLELFHLQCDTGNDENAFQELFPQQFGMPIQAFCQHVATVANAFLIFDDIHPLLCKEENLKKLQNVVAAILDFCPFLRIVVISRISPDKDIFPFIKLHPLDVPDVNTYLQQHPDVAPGLDDPDIIYKLHERSDGLPMYLDRILKSLKIASLESVLSEEMEGPPENESVPKALAYAVNNLAQSKDKRSQRSFRLLKVLSVLPYGETLEVLKHFFHAEPFYIANAMELNELELLDVIPLKHASPRVDVNANGLNEDKDPKILKVPRQIGQYVLTILSDNEREEIVSAGTMRFFGSRWQEGKVKLRTLPFVYREYLNSGVGNEFALIHHLLTDALRKGDIPTAKKAAGVGIQYCYHVTMEDRYRDLAVIATGLMQQIERESMPEQWGELAALAGRALRMTGKTTEALEYLHNALETNKKHLSKDTKALIWLNIALAEKKIKHTDLAITAAAEVKKLVVSNSGFYLQATAIEVELSLKGTRKTARLKELEQKARDTDNLIVANTITLELAESLKNPIDKIQLFDRVLKSEGRGYNQTRAIVAKANAIDKIHSPQTSLTSSDMNNLALSYSYLYSQRFGSLFDQCHASLWNLLESRGNTPQLIRLFRYSSFLWRIRGEDTKEKEYLIRLKAQNTPSLDGLNLSRISLELSYYWGRVKLMGVKITRAITS